MNKLRDNTLKILINNLGKNVPFDYIAQSLSIDIKRAHKVVENLTKMGANIKRTPTSYKLVDMCDIYLDSVFDYYSKSSAPRYIYEECTSTNNIANMKAKENAPSGTLIITERQLSGRGRLSRQWLSPIGGVWMSVILRTQLTILKLMPITLLCAVAVSMALEELLDEVPILIKWPNDIYINNKKICGILIETKSTSNEVDYIVAGIGINANNTTSNFDKSLGIVATSLIDLGISICKVQLASLVLDKVIKVFSDYEKQKSIDFVYEYYMNHMLWQGDKAYLTNTATGERAYTGTVIGIGKQGQLLLKVDTKIMEIISGELSLRREE